LSISVSVLTAWAGNNTHTITSGSFTPAANSLVVVCTGCGNGPGVTVTGLTVTDSVSGSWSDLVHLTAGGQFADASVWAKDAGASPSSQTVTVSLSPSTVLDIGLVVLQVTGAAPVASQTGVTNKSTASATVTLTPGTTGSQVVGAAGWAGTTAVTANASSTLYGQTHDATNGASEGAFFATTTSTGGTAKTVGFTSAPSGVGMAAAEILPASSTTWNGALAATATAGASFGGTKTAFKSLSAAATAHASFGGNAIPAGKVVRSGTGIYKDGNPFRIVGFNTTPMATASWSHPPNYDGRNITQLSTMLADIRTTAPHVNAIRVWFFQQFAINSGVRDWSSFDTVLSTANSYGFKVIATLEDSWSYERTGSQTPALDATWYNGGYSSSVLTAELISYRAWAAECVGHYANDPRVLMWELVNEPNSITLSFVQDMAPLLKGIDPNTLLCCGEAATVGSSIYAVAGIDMASYHYYTDYSQTDFATTASVALAQGKPTYIGENGYDSTDSSRSTELQTLWTSVFGTSGLVGALYWQYAETGGDIFEITGPSDPLMPVIDSFAPATTLNRSLAAAVTAHASFSGTKTALEHLSPAATAHASFSGTKTALEHLSPAATAHASFTGTRTKFSSLATTVTAHATFSGTKTALGHLAPAVTAHTVFSGTKTTFGHLNAAVTAHASFTATHTVVRPPQNLGALLSQVNYAGANSFATVLSGANSTSNALAVSFSQTGYAGTAVVNSPLGVSMSQVNLGGSITMITFSGSATGWTMQNINLSLAEFNDIVLSTTVTTSGSALNLTGMTVKMLLKPTAGILDTDPSVKSVTATIVTPSAGLCTISIPHSDLQSQALTFYRIDVIDGSGDINTAAYGTITYTAL